MVRKLGAAVVVLGLMLIGFQPIASPMMGAMATTMDMDQPCCTDCDQPAMPDRSNCDTVTGCVVSLPLTILVSDSIPVEFPARVASLFPDQPAAVSADSAPPFRPPRY